MAVLLFLALKRSSFASVQGLHCCSWRNWVGWLMTWAVPTSDPLRSHFVRLLPLSAHKVNKLESNRRRRRVTPAWKTFMNQASVGENSTIYAKWDLGIEVHHWCLSQEVDPVCLKKDQHVLSSPQRTVGYPYNEILHCESNRKQFKRIAGRRRIRRLGNLKEFCTHRALPPNMDLDKIRNFETPVFFWLFVW